MVLAYATHNSTPELLSGYFLTEGSICEARNVSFGGPEPT